MNTHPHQIAHLRPGQILEEIKKTPIAYLPLGPLEWHGPHLPLGVDPLNAEYFSHQVVEITGGLVFPTLYWGTERERTPETLDWIGFTQEDWITGMDFPANSMPSLYAHEEIFALLVREQLRLMSSLNFHLVVIISGHCASNHMTVLHRLAAEFNHQGKCRVLVVVPFPADEHGQFHVGHADRTETSLMLAHYPDVVALNKLPDDPTPLRNIDWAVVDSETFEGQPTPEHTLRPEHDPRLASADEGFETTQQIIRQITELVKSTLSI